MRFLSIKISIIRSQLIQHNLIVFGILIGDNVIHIPCKALIAHALYRAGQTAGYELAFFYQINAVIGFYKIYQACKILIGNF